MGWLSQCSGQAIRWLSAVARVWGGSDSVVAKLRGGSVEWPSYELVQLVQWPGCGVAQCSGQATGWLS